MGDVKMQNSGVLINIPDCFPYCGVGSEIKQQLQNTVQSCFPFCGVPARSMNNLLQVAALPACFPNCGVAPVPTNPPTKAPAPVTSQPSIVPSALFKPCFPFCDVPLSADVVSLFPSCFPFCGVKPVDQVTNQN